MYMVLTCMLLTCVQVGFVVYRRFRRIIQLSWQQKCVDEHTEFRQCLRDNPPEFNINFDVFNDCFRSSGCTAPVLEEVFNQFLHKYIPASNRSARRCLQTVLFPRLSQLERCVGTQHGYKWFFAYFTDNDVLSASHARSMGFLCDGNQSRIREVHYCLNNNRINIRQLRNSVCSAVQHCNQQTDGVSPVCAQHTNNMSTAVCFCVRQLFLQNDAALIDDLAECYLGNLPEGYEQIKQQVVNDTKQLHCAYLRDNFNLHERWLNDC